MSDNDVNVKFGADVGGAEAAITELRETMEGFAATSKPMSSTGKTGRTGTSEITP